MSRMKVLGCFLLFLLFQSGWTKICNKTMEEDLAMSGLCVGGKDDVMCRDVCGGPVIEGQLNCTKAKHCCFKNNTCYLKQSSKVPKIYSTKEILDGVNPIKGRNLVLNYGRMLPSIGCPAGYPDNCLGLPSPDDFTPPVNIPYCHRIPCAANGSVELDSKFQKCLQRPGCYFDFELFLYRQSAGQAIMPGVPVCHLAVRNEAFHKRAAEYRATKPWIAPVTRCILREFKNETGTNSPGCYMVNVLEHFKYKPKSAGWIGIKEDDCYMINGCWKGGKCFYPMDESKIQVPAHNDNNTVVPEILVPHGLPECLKVREDPSPRELLEDYHHCLAAGCSTSVHPKIIEEALENIAVSNYIPQHLQYYFSRLVKSGKVRPDNWRKIADKLIADKKDVTSTFFGAVFPLGTKLNLPPGSKIRIVPFAFNLTANVTRHNTTVTPQSGAGGVTGRGYSFFNPALPPGARGGARRRRPGPMFRGSAYSSFSNLGIPLKPGSKRRGSYGISHFGGGTTPPSPPLTPPNIGNIRSELSSGGLEGLNSIQHFIGLPFIGSYFPVITIPCPYRHFRWVGFPPLKGALTGCCRKPDCFLGTYNLRGAKSGIASYLGSWESWSPCSKSCGTGESRRKKICIGEECPHIPEEKRSCNPLPCSGWTPWGSWEECDKTCGAGMRQRKRVCKAGAGKCSGSSINTVSCFQSPCITYTQWGRWGFCTIQGVRYRYRHCIGMYPCPNNVEEQKCLKSKCDKQTCVYIDRVRCKKNTPGCNKKGIIEIRTTRYCCHIYNFRPGR